MTLEHRHVDARPSARVAVIGARGFVGSAVTARLRTAAVAVVAIGSDDVDLLAPGSDARLRTRLDGCDAAVFVSAIAPAKALTTVIDNLHMVEAAAAALDDGSRHVIYISSDAVYADDVAMVTDATATAPTSLHGAMHLTREIALRHLLGDRLCVLRPTLLYGVDDPHNGYGPNRFLRQAEAGEEIRLFGDGEERRDHVHVDDLARVVHTALGRRSFGVLDVATGQSTSFSDVAHLAVAVAGANVAVVGTPRQNPITHRYFDIAPRLGAYPDLAMTGLEDGLRRVHSQRLLSQRPAG
ncbi:MAG: NAD-dependent epimerase/dehydratase family protein [Acidimicrobiales bacterium]